MKEHDSGVLYQAVTNRRIQLGFLLPSFLCLDAPLVALGWSVAVTFDSGGSTDTCIPKLLLLFFGVWSVYLADRIYDSYRLSEVRDLTSRHRFAIRFRPLMWTLLATAAVAGLSQLINIKDPSYLSKGVILAAATAVYFAVFRLVPNCWCRWIRGKEIVISLCFAFGVMLTADTTGPSILNGILALGLASICLYNCLIISYSESAFDGQHDPQAFYALRPELPPPAWPGWISGIAGCLVFLIDGGLLVGSSLLISSAALHYLSRSIDRDKSAPFVQAAADALLLLPWPIVILIVLIL